MSFTPRTGLGDFQSTHWYQYAVARTGIEMPNCFTYATGRISEIVGYDQSLDPTNNRVNGAQDLWYTHHENFTNSSTPCEGALMIWQYGTWGHVAVCENSDGTAWSQSNYGGANFEYITGSPYGYWGMTFLGYLVHKDLGNTFSTDQLISEHAKATFTVDQLNARVNGPNGTVCRQYNTGDSVTYDYKWVGNGHRYICWYEAENLIMVAVNGNESGTEPWANFEEDIQLEDETGYAKYKVDDVNVRKDSPSGDVYKTIGNGTVIAYTQKCVTSDHRYISYVENGTRYYVVCSPTTERSTEYCDFYSEDPSPTDATDSGNTDSNDTNDNGFTEVNEGEVEQPDLKDETLDDDFVTVDLISHDIYSYKCPYVMEPKTIVIHNAGTPNGTASNLHKGLHNTKEYKSWHFSVDDKDVIESLPLNRNAFATGDGGTGVGNRTGIQIEIAKDMDTDTKAEWSKARANGAKLTAILLKKYGWTIDKVSKHQDYKMTDGTYKYCPHKILDEGWDEFLRLIQTYLDGMDGTTEEPTDNTLSETNNLLKTLIELLKKIFSIFSK